MPSLYDLVAAMESAADLLQHAETPEQVEGARRMLDSLVDKADDKVDAIGHVLLNLKRREDACAQDISELRGRKEKWKNEAARLQAMVVGIMEVKGFTKLEGARCTLTKVKGRESVTVDHLPSLPDEHVVARVTFAGSRSAMKEVLNRVPAEVAVHTYDEEAVSASLKGALAVGEVPGASIDVSPATLRVYRSMRPIEDE